MKKYSICIIGVYFGMLPKYFNLWLKSCENNKDVDFLIIGDNSLENLPQNVRCVEMTIDQMRMRADKALGFKTVLDRPYKCCDFKVVYGMVFQDLLTEYDFWGHCDFDLIFGDIRKFITSDILCKYDKILDLGHLSLYRNTPQCNNRFKLPGSLCGDDITTYTTKRITAFDERGGIFQIYKSNNLPMYDKNVYADIASVYKQFRLIEKKNYKYQTFYVENGAVYRAYYENGTVNTDEFLYIHFKKRGFNSTLENSNKRYYITPQGFEVKSGEDVPSLDEIKKTNPYSIKQEIIDEFKKAMAFVVRKKNGLRRRIKVFLKQEGK